MAHRFKCPQCEKWHEGFPDVGYDRPKYAADIPEGERAERVFLTSELCAVDNVDFFVRCILPIRVRDTNDEFRWGVWSSLSKDNFLRYDAGMREDLSDWQPMFGYLSNQLDGYPDTLNLRLSVQTRGSRDRPIVTLEPSDHPLSIEQRDGISLDKVLKIVAPFLDH